MAATLLMAAAVQCVVAPGGSPCVRATTRAATSGPSGGMRVDRVLSPNRPPERTQPSGLNHQDRLTRAVFGYAATRALRSIVKGRTERLPSPSSPNASIERRDQRRCREAPVAARLTARRRIRDRSSTE